MSSSQLTSEDSLPKLLAELEGLLVVWAERPEKSNRKRLAQLNVSMLVLRSRLH